MLKISGNVVDGKSSKIVESVSYDNKSCEVVFQLFNGLIRRKKIILGRECNFALSFPDEAYLKWFGELNDH